MIPNFADRDGSTLAGLKEVQNADVSSNNSTGYAAGVADVMTALRTYL
jgi:hypothetical protein